MFNVHRKYLLSKINIIIISFIIILTILAYLFLFNPFKVNNMNWLNKQEAVKLSIDNLIFINKFIGVLVGSFLFGNSFSLHQDSYNVLFLKSRKDRMMFFYTKVLSIIGLIGSIYLIIGFTNILLVFNKLVYLKSVKDLVLINIESFLLSIVYGAISILMIQIFKSQLVLLVPLILFIISEILSINAINIYFPTLTNIVTFKTLIHKIILFILYIKVSSFVYYNKDL